eukprot:TRINITY_DN43886_c0_g1_i1.p1 TRINITY_DN43886_c0_g1~~TRINITY_DN43886_c0_g1_i1.p1  ORF type:complete len:652 (-),score=175.83 TRINITY_DN43886_c0_g1_i1:320-2275(-)
MGPRDEARRDHSASWGHKKALSLGDSLISTSYGETVAGTLGHTFFGETLFSSSADEPACFANKLEPGGVYPRVITAIQLLEESDTDESIFCGPPSEPGFEGLSELKALEAWGLFFPEEREVERRKRKQKKAKEAGERRQGKAPRKERERNRDRERPQALPTGPVEPGASPGKAGAEDEAPAHEGGGGRPQRQQNQKSQLIQPRGTVEGDNQKFVGVFQIGLEDDEEFCLVKRILGKSGNNMRRIAEEFDAKVRLRGIGSGFLEGSDGREANMPLQLNVSCTDFDAYKGACEKIASLLAELYRHYRRYVKSQGMEPPDIKVNLEEVRRDDLNIDLLALKAARTQSEREQDRKQREQERRQLREKERERAREAAEKAGVEYVPKKEKRMQLQVDEEDASSDEEKDGKPRYLLPTGQPLPRTGAERRAAARAGGAAVGAAMSAAVREAERLERNRQRNSDRRDKRDGGKAEVPALEEPLAVGYQGKPSQAPGDAAPEDPAEKAEVAEERSREGSEDREDRADRERCVSPEKPQGREARDRSDDSGRSDDSEEEEARRQRRGRGHGREGQGGGWDDRFGDDSRDAWGSYDQWSRSPGWRGWNDRAYDSYSSQGSSWWQSGGPIGGGGAPPDYYDAHWRQGRDTWNAGWGSSGRGW